MIGEAARAVPQEVETVEELVRPGRVEMLIVDGADRLKPLALGRASEQGGRRSVA